jgi:hypothetical protein
MAEEAIAQTWLPPASRAIAAAMQGATQNGLTNIERS